MQKLIITIFFITCTWFTACYGQTNASAALDSIKTLRSLLITLHQDRITYIKAIDNLAGQINQIKQEDYQNYFKRRRLENLLREFFEINETLNQVEKQITGARDQENRWYQIILKDNSDAGLEDFRAVSGGQPIAQSLKQAGIDSQKHQQNLHNILKVIFQSGIDLKNPLTIEPDDTPRQIERKADLLKDREDRLRTYAKLVQQKIQQGKQQIELRQRMGDFLDDLTLFDPRDESVGANRGSTEKTASTTEELGRGVSYDKGQYLEPGTFNSPIAPVKEEIFKLNFNELSISDTEDMIDKLQKFLTTIEQKADSLASEAKKFYLAAKTRRNETRK